MAQRWEDADVESRWREWLGAKFRAYAGIMIGVLAFGTIAGVGLVGATGGPGGAPAVTQSEEASAGGSGEAHEMETHGRCVSKAAKAATEAGLKGKVRGAFMKTVSQDPEAAASKDEAGENCDFSAALADAVEAQEAADAEPKGNRPEDAGKPEDKGKPESLPGKGNAGSED